MLGAFNYLAVAAICAVMAMAQEVAGDETDASLNDGHPYSNNVLEDAKLSVPELITKYGYPSEVHTVTSPDGYILEMHRIPHGHHSNTTDNPNKRVVLLMHGLLASSSVWVLSGPGAGLGYILADEGYDVWMGNVRGSTYSRRHVKLNPDAILDPTYWQFSWDEMGIYDLPTMIDYILNKTQKKKLYYIGHSQGTTVFFVMTSLLPEYNKKIISMHAMGPVAYLAHNTNPLLRAITTFSREIQAADTVISHGEFLPHNFIFDLAAYTLCREQVVTQSICSNTLFIIGGWNEAQLNKTMLPTIYGHVPAGSSIQQLAHYAQGIETKQFRRYDHANKMKNLEAYGTIVPPKYDLSKITTPVSLHYADNDPVVNTKDVEPLFRELGNPIGKYRVPLASFTHFDFMWAIDAKEFVYNKLISVMASMTDTDLVETDSK